MKQNKKGLAKLLAVLGVVAVIGAVGVAVFAFQGASADGQITVLMPSFEDGALTFVERLDFAKNLKATTDINGPNAGSPNSHWAPAGAHSTFQGAIDTAEAVRNRIGIFRRGQEFDVQVNIAGNTTGANGGFAAMMLRMQLPPQLEIVNVRQGTNFTHNDSFQGGPGYNSANGNITPARTGTVVLGWSGRNSGNFNTASGTIMTFTLKVRDGAALGTTPYVTMGFGTEMDPPGDMPVRILGNRNDQLSMSIQGTVMTDVFTPVNIGRVHIIP